MYKNTIKRIIDLGLSIILIIPIGLLTLFIAPIIYLEDRGSVFYIAERLGFGGSIFRMYKFRSMKMDAPDIRNYDGTTYNSESDERLTKIGKLLRKTSIDELPQIFNVIKGDMSFIGPRPDLPDSIELYDNNIKKKLNVKPGITGYSQAYYRNSSTLEQRFSGDVYYSENVSFMLDLKIFLLTIKSVLTKKDIYRNENLEEFLVKK